MTTVAQAPTKRKSPTPLEPRACAVCQKIVYRNEHDRTHSKQFYCSLACKSVDQRRNLDADFWTHVEKTPGCWIWIGLTLNKRGRSYYGTLRRQNTTLYAHRVAWEREHGPIPAGLFVCHRCDNPACVRAVCTIPDCLHSRESTDCESHLFLGTHAENVQDAAAKQRMHPGEANGMAKLTAVQVLEIRAAYIPRKVTQKQLAARYGVTEGAIKSIVYGVSWAWLKPPLP